MNIFFLNVGYGEAIVVINKDFCMVVDGGSNKKYIYEDASTVMLSDFLKEMNVEKIDVMVLTHIHDDHIGGLLPVVKDFPVKELWLNFMPSTFSDETLEEKIAILHSSKAETLYMEAILFFNKLLKISKEKGIFIRSLCLEDGPLWRGDLKITPLGMNRKEMESTAISFQQMLEMKDETEFLKKYLQMDRECNSTSLALHITQGEGGVLLTGDKVSGWDWISTKFQIKSDVLKLTHHGQLDGMPESMLLGADPQIIIVCADRYRTYNSSHPDILKRAREFLRQKGITEHVYITGELKKYDGEPGRVISIQLMESHPDVRIM